MQFTFSCFNDWFFSRCLLIEFWRCIGLNRVRNPLDVSTDPGVDAGVSCRAPAANVNTHECDVSSFVKYRCATKAYKHPCPYDSIIMYSVHTQYRGLRTRTCMILCAYTGVFHCVYRCISLCLGCYDCLRHYGWETFTCMLRTLPVSPRNDTDHLKSAVCALDRQWTTRIALQSTYV